MESSNIPAQNVANEEPIGRKESNMTAANKNIIGWVDKSTPSSELGLWRNLNVHQSFQDSELHDTTNSKSNVSMASTTSKCST